MTGGQHGGSARGVRWRECGCSTSRRSWPAPQISAILGDFGADVVKIEPPAGEASRKIGAQRNGASLMWALASRNKRTITLDLTDRAGP